MSVAAECGILQNFRGEDLTESLQFFFGEGCNEPEEDIFHASNALKTDSIVGDKIFDVGVSQSCHGDLEEVIDSVTFAEAFEMSGGDDLLGGKVRHG